MNNAKGYNLSGTNISSYSAYITFSTVQEASIAILSVDYTLYDDLLIRACFGSTKYCSHFLKNIECTSKNCLYYHYIVNEKDIILKVNNLLNYRKKTVKVHIGSQ